jgi:hypothetical protein
MSGLWRNHPASPHQQSLSDAPQPGQVSQLTQADLHLSMPREARAQGRAVELPAIMRAGIAQHGARLHELRERDFVIVNEMERYDGIIRSRYRLTFNPERERR